MVEYIKQKYANEIITTNDKVKQSNISVLI